MGFLRSLEPLDPLTYRVFIFNELKGFSVFLFTLCYRPDFCQACNSGLFDWKLN